VSLGAIVKTWVPAVAGVTALVLALCLVHSRRAMAAARIDTLGLVACDLSESAERVQALTRRGEDLIDVDQRRKELDRRMADSCMPGLVQAQLMSAARKVGLQVHGIQPITAAIRLPGSAGPPAYPNYSVSVSGEYRQIAEYMDACTRQPLPARVKRFAVARQKDEAGGVRKGLEAEITVEAFQPASPIGNKAGA